jgi:ankyrin repeat protein
MNKYKNIIKCLLDDSLFLNNASQRYLEFLEYDKEYDKNLLENLSIRIKGEIKRAIINKDKEKLTKLFKDTPDFINSNIYQNYTPLAFAIKQNDKEMAEFLIEQGAQLEGIHFDCSTY